VATSLTTVYEKTGLDRDVIKITSQILDADPTNNSMRYDRAMAFYKLANYKEALDGFKQVSSFESDANALYYAAISAGGLGKIDEGLNYANQLIATSQSYSECYFVRAQFLIRLHRYSEAISDLDKTKSRGEKISFLNYFYYLSFKALGDRDKAAIQCAALQQQTDVPDQIRTLVPSECTRRKG
jgi:tetratricopeptide (TPR) repeat protein